MPTPSFGCWPATSSADQLLELTGHVLADQRWPHRLAVAEGELHVALDTHDDL